MNKNNSHRRPAAPRSTSFLAVAALACGALGLALCLFPLAALGLVLGLAALNRIDNPVNRLSGRGAARAGALLGGAGTVWGVAVPMAALLMFPALGSARSDAEARNAFHIRRIHQGLVNHAAGNKEWYAGISPYGRIYNSSPNLKDGLRGFEGVEDAPYTYAAESGETPATRLAILLNGKFFDKQYAISPDETRLGTDVAKQIVPAPNEIGYTITMTANGGNCSYAWLHVREGAAGRYNTWKDNSNGSAAVLSDRGLIAGNNQGGLTTTSIHVLTDADASGDSLTGVQNQWRGHVIFNDNSARWSESAAIKGTRYGAKANTREAGDNIFVGTDGGAGDDANAFMEFSGP